MALIHRISLVFFYGQPPQAEIKKKVHLLISDLQCATVLGTYAPTHVAVLPETIIILAAPVPLEEERNCSDNKCCKDFFAVLQPQ